jgi:hypothetical protein
MKGRMRRTVTRRTKKRRINKGQMLILAQVTFSNEGVYSK